MWQNRNGNLYCRNPQIRGVTHTPVLSVLSLDIETNAHTQEILSIACSGKQQAVYIRGSGSDVPPVGFCKNEQELLARFFEHLKKEDPDILIGWNVVDFDLWTIQERCNH